MSEYIITVHNEPEEDGCYRLTKPAEPIVRCRDCKYCMAYWRSDYCDYFKHVTNDPDGYCAWAERREQ